MNVAESSSQVEMGLTSLNDSNPRFGRAVYIPLVKKKTYFTMKVEEYET